LTPLQFIVKGTFTSTILSTSDRHKPPVSIPLRQPWGGGGAAECL